MNVLPSRRRRAPAFSAWKYLECRLHGGRLGIKTILTKEAVVGAEHARGLQGKGAQNCSHSNIVTRLLPEGPTVTRRYTERLNTCRLYTASWLRQLLGIVPLRKA